MIENQAKYHISAEEFAQKFQKRELGHAQLIDVREPEEWEVYHLRDSQLIPLASLPTCVSKLDPKKPIYLFCAHGIRSLHAANFLLSQGFKDVINVDGGLAEVSIYLEENGEK
ncbi:rhodanese-like domain-containing protein [Thermoflavimicrobium daqui]|jgi:rhodanese-related sulfurtransferase|uniref:Sulfurtransferase n=1 Tax=Thermoflavimicrobium daqui TaxID=2137476 RepID=A0A364K2P3_9BACL|nr:rhodanese-like domain-containing protein [Thermoflavimicrobium daqui]RAL22657.1 sulfurtransferase [Thermoflavimicrobium daqui]